MQNQCATKLKQGFLKQHAKFWSHLEFLISSCYQCHHHLHFACMAEWEEFKLELIDIKKKYQLLKENLTDNNLKLKKTASEWVLQFIVKGFREDNYIYICELAKIALITPVTDAWPERGASAVKRVKSRIRSTMKNGFLNFLLHISINGPSANGKQADQLLERVCNVYTTNEKHKKIPQVYSLAKTESSS